VIGHTNQLSVPEVSCYSREHIEGGVIIRYMIRKPGEVEWRSVKVFRADEPPAPQREAKRS
jgi:hypothetical protein